MDENVFHGDYVYKLLKSGRENALSMSELAATCGLTERQLRAQIQKLRLQGAAIAGDASGYFLPETEEELLAAYKQCFRRAKNSFRCLQPLKRALRLKGYYFYKGIPKKDPAQEDFKF